jgi:hypothetical protein
LGWPSIIEGGAATITAVDTATPTDAATPPPTAAPATPTPVAAALPSDDAITSEEGAAAATNLPDPNAAEDEDGSKEGSSEEPREVPPVRESGLTCNYDVHAPNRFAFEGALHGARLFDRDLRPMMPLNVSPLLILKLLQACD